MRPARAESTRLESSGNGTYPTSCACTLRRRTRSELEGAQVVRRELREEPGARARGIVPQVQRDGGAQRPEQHVTRGLAEETRVDVGHVVREGRERGEAPEA